MKNKFLISIFLLCTILLTPTLYADNGDDEGDPATPAPVACVPDRDFRNCSVGDQTDIDCDCIIDTADNCQFIFNPNQTNRNSSEFGDACDAEFQREFRRNLASQLSQEQTSTDNPQTPGELDFQGCVFDQENPDVTSNAPSWCDAGGLDSEKWLKLISAYDNNLIVSVLEEPISSENIYNRAQVCSTKYLRDINGMLQFTDSPNENLQIDFDITPDEEGIAIENAYEQAQATLVDAAGRPVAIAIDSCQTAYVENCFPQNTYERQIPYGDPLPQIVSCSQVQLLFADSGTDLIKQYVGLIYRWATGIIGVIAVLVIMINGIMISFAQGDDGKVSEAKGRIIQSLSALAILFLAGLILYSINPNFFTTQNLQYQPESTTQDLPQDDEEEATDTDEETPVEEEAPE